MTVLILNGKGGVLKTTTIVHLLNSFPFWNGAFDFDPSGALCDVPHVKELVQHVPLDVDVTQIEFPKDMNILIDTGAQIDHRSKPLAEMADLIIVPYHVGTLSAAATRRTLEHIKDVKTPMLMLSTMVPPTYTAQDIEDDLDSIIETFEPLFKGKEVAHHSLGASMVYKTAQEEGQDIMKALGAEIDKNGRPTPMHLRKRKWFKQKKELLELQRKIENF